MYLVVLECDMVFIYGIPVELNAKWIVKIHRVSLTISSFFLKSRHTSKTIGWKYMYAPLLNFQLFGTSTQLGCRQLLQITNGVILIAFHPNLLSQSVVQHYLDHDCE